jgi:hypothetical protein
LFTRDSGFQAASGTRNVEDEIEFAKMPEIDPQFGDSRADSKLTEALRHLAASSQQGAPAEIGAGLATAFRRHHVRRRRVRRAGIAGVVACLVAIAGLVILRAPHHADSTAQTYVTPMTVPVKAPEVLQTASAPGQTRKPVRKSSQPRVTTRNVAYSRQFVALPGYDPEVPVEDLHIVRVQLPTSTLWQMGAPINPAGPERRVLADFVIGQDGTPYGVRLVQ